MRKKNQPKNFNRRDFLKQSLVAGAVLTSASSSQASEIQWASAQNESRYPILESTWQNTLKTHDIPYDGLVSSLKSENHYACEIRGNFPTDLKGTLFRTGPGLFERGGMRRRMLIDVDGMVRRFQINNGQVTFTNRHIRTEKFVAEEKAGRYLYPSFAMHVPAAKTLFGNSVYNPFTNSVANIKNQASVTVFSFGGRLFATDEVQPITELDINTLATKGELTLLNNSGLKFMAHSRISYFGHKRLHLASFDPIRSHLQILTFNENFQKTEETQSIKVPRSFHDWHVTPEFYVIFLPPAYMGKAGLAQAIAGLTTVADSVKFRTEERAQVLLIPRNGRPAKLFNLPETLDSMHSVNAFQKPNGEVVFDFVAAKKRYAVASNQSVFAKIMRGEVPQNGPARENAVARVTIDYTNTRASYSGNYFRLNGIEMPTVDQRLIGQDYTHAYFLSGRDGYDNALVRLNVKTGEQDKYDFGPLQFVTEPIFAPSTQTNNAYVLSEIYHHPSRKSFLAVFDAKNLKQGPIAQVWLKHHLPFGIHGFWLPG